MTNAREPIYRLTFDEIVDIIGVSAYWSKHAYDCSPSEVQQELWALANGPVPENQVLMHLVKDGDCLMTTCKAQKFCLDIKHLILVSKEQADYAKSFSRSLEVIDRLEEYLTENHKPKAVYKKGPQGGHSH